MSDKRQTKAMQDRHERILNELLKIPGNEYCADCRSKNPRWASYSLGVFLCVRCAGIHRKMGTHISRIKSLSMDQWTVEQIESIKNGGGNIKVNNIVNPNPGKYPLPLADDEGHAMEKYIRNKWEKRAFMEKATLGPSLAVVPSGVQQQSRPQHVPQRSSSVPAIMSDTDGMALTKLREMGFKDDYKNQTVLRQTQGNINAAVDILTRLYQQQQSRDTQHSLSDDQKLVQLRNMGYTDMAANRDALRRTGGNVDVAVTILKNNCSPSVNNGPMGASLLLDVSDSPSMQTNNNISSFPFQQQHQQQQQQQFNMQPQQQYTIQQQSFSQPQQQQPFSQPQQQPFSVQQQQPFSVQQQPQLQYSIPEQQQQYTLQQQSPFSISSASDPFGQNTLPAPVQSTSLQTSMHSSVNNSFGTTHLAQQQQPTTSNPFSTIHQQPLTPSSPFTNYLSQQPQQQHFQQQPLHPFPINSFQQQQQQFSQSSFF
ncbi:hypothetical protein BC941DRAFT_402556 [Chlamydoabsidia padenii]|nr:hypothetical protein BC941DRAFT_402556 [Chlamydoabsidia padenii]